MKMVRMHGYGGPEVLSLDEVDLPEPGPGQVRVAVGAIGLNRAETMFMRGDFGQYPLPLPVGFEAAGTVESVGTGVTAFAVGDPVAIYPGAGNSSGACADRFVISADHLIRNPAGLSDVAAAATWMAYLTAYGVRAFRPIQPGDAVLINAASSSVGLAAIQIVTADGGVPIAVTRGGAKAEALKTHGAAHVIASDEQDVATIARDLTGGHGAAIAFDAVGGPAFAGMLGALRHGGLAIAYGGLGGEASSFYPPMLAMQGQTIQGFSQSAIFANPAWRDAAPAYVRKGLEAGQFSPVVDRVFPIAEIAQAYRYLLGNMQVGKVVVTSQ